MDDTTNREDELVEGALRDHYETSYGPTRPPDAVWSGVEPALRLSSPTTEADTRVSAAPPAARRNHRAQSDWMPLPPGYRKQRSPLVIGRVTLVAAVVTAGLLLVALLLSAQLTPKPQPLASKPTATATAGGIARNIIATVQPSAWGRGGTNNWAYEISIEDEKRGTALIKSITDNPQFEGALNHKLNVEQHRGERVRFSAYIWTEEVQGRAGLWMMVQDDQGVNIAQDEMRDRPLLGTTERQRYEVVLDLPANAKYATIGAQLEGKGRVYLEEARLEVVDKRVATTGGPPPYNLGFETGLSSWFAGNTSQGNSDYQVTADTSTSHTGNSSALIESKQGITKSSGLVSQMFPIDAYSGQRIRISAFVKADSVETYGGLWAAVDERTAFGARTHAFDNMENRPITGTADWTPYSIVLDAPAAASTLRVGGLLNGRGRLWFDDFTIEAVDTSVAVTGYTTQKVPTNLGFEQGLDGWYAWAGRAYAVNHMQHWGGGVGSVNLTATKGPFGVRAYLIQYFLSDDYRNRKVRVTAYVRTRDVGGAAYLQIATVNVRNSNLADSTKLTGTTDWTRLEATIQVPDDSGRLAISFLLEGEGTIWIDDVTVEEVE
jgi:hypothetical protein